MSDFLRLRAHAKLNLALRVGARRDDGFHPLATVFQTVSLCDLLYARRERRDPDGGLLRLEVEGAELPADNTVSRAVELLADEVRAHGFEPAPLHMRLIKRVPSGAGLGGGSSDAVAALAACVRLWHLAGGILQESGALQRIAAQVGSDVPFFLLGGTALGTGRGTRIEPLDPLLRTWFVIAAPPLHVDTAAAYAAFDRAAQRDSAGDGPRAALAALPQVPSYRPRLDPAWVGNDFAEPVCALHPEVEAVRARLAALGAHVAQMTGSGAASFGAFASRRAGARAARRLRAEGLWARIAVSITSAQQLRALFGSDAASGQV